jgi:hypothetical protein
VLQNLDMPISSARTTIFRFALVYTAVCAASGKALIAVKPAAPTATV